MSTAAAAWTDKEVHAFVDGRLDAETTARFAAQVRHDLALAERVARARALRRKLGIALPPSTLLPQAVAAEAKSPAGTSKESSSAAATSARPVGHALPSPLWWCAAALLAVIAGLIGWSLPRASPALLVQKGHALVAEHQLERALDERISAEGSTSEGILVSLSFKAGDGRYCRTFSLASGIDGLACRATAGWMVEATGRAHTDSASAYGAPSTELSNAVLAAISRWQAGAALTREQERQVRDAGWR